MLLLLLNPCHFAFNEDFYAIEIGHVPLVLFIGPEMRPCRRPTKDLIYLRTTRGLKYVKRHKADSKWA